ncbi:MAG: DNA-processing protein DprA [bacterium]
MANDRKNWLSLNLVPGIGPGKMQNLIARFGSPDKVFEASRDELLAVESIDKLTAEAILGHKTRVNLDRELELIDKHGIKIVTIQDGEYPLSLKFIFDPPLLLYVKGTLIPEDNIAVAMVGARRGTAYGKTVTEKLSGELAKKGITVISGLARGVDTWAHRGALAKGGRTIAVLGSGLGVIYPPENKSLAENIAGQGAVVSEFPMMTIPDRGNFPRRNRLISGLSLGTVVVEAAEESGALITAGYALEQGREVFAVPGNIYSNYSRGTHKLIRQGAKLTANVEDIIEEIESLRQMCLMAQKEPLGVSEEAVLTPEEQQVYATMTSDPLYIDQISDNSKININLLASVLVALEMKGRIKQLSGKRFMKF